MMFANCILTEARPLFKYLGIHHIALIHPKFPQLAFPDPVEERIVSLTRIRFFSVISVFPRLSDSIAPAPFRSKNTRPVSDRKRGVSIYHPTALFYAIASTFASCATWLNVATSSAMSFFKRVN